MLILMLIIILGAFLYVLILYSSNTADLTRLIMFIVFGVLCVIVGISIFVVFVVCCPKYFQVREIFLKSIVIPKGNR